MSMLIGSLEGFVRHRTSKHGEEVVGMIGLEILSENCAAYCRIGLSLSVAGILPSVFPS